MGPRHDEWFDVGPAHGDCGIEDGGTLGRERLLRLTALRLPATIGFLPELSLTIEFSPGPMG
jgi:hypothetical protein